VPGDVETRIRLVTRRPSLLPTSQARTPIGSPCGSLSLASEGEGTGFPRSASEVRGVRCLLSTGEFVDHEAAPSRPTSHSRRACQPLWLAAVTIFIADSHSFTIPATWPSPASWLAGGSSSHDSLPAHRRCASVLVSGPLLIQIPRFTQ
jgi:hypothetical protein